MFTSEGIPDRMNYLVLINTIVYNNVDDQLKCEPEVCSNSISMRSLLTHPARIFKFGDKVFIG